MIQVNELRLGNYFFIGGLDRYVKVSGVFLSHFKCTDENGIDFNNHQNNIKPIELTEDVLLKCPDIENRNTKPKSYYLYNRIIFINDNVCYDYTTRVKLPYLHTFQNFIFALTNEELNINL